MSDKRPSRKIREFVASRAGYLCEYCKCPKSYIPCPFDVEHIIPLCLGGNDEISNLAYSCNGCNICKGIKIEDYDPVDGEMTDIFHPRNHRWQDHFVWDDSGLLIKGTTPIGRSTVESLQLNREEVVNLREILMLAGKHPPKESL